MYSPGTASFIILAVSSFIDQLPYMSKFRSAEIFSDRPIQDRRDLNCAFSTPDHAQNAFRSAANMAPAEWNHTHHLVKAIRNASDVFRSIGKNVERSERHMNFL